VTKRRIAISIKGERETAQEFLEAWRRAERGRAAEQPIERLYFEDLATLLKTLTPRRIDALRTLSERGPQSVRALARLTRRDYKNVHRDTALLERVGLVSRTADGRLVVPWKTIVAEIKLAA